MIQFLTDREIYEKVICKMVPNTKHTLWIATADIKDMYVTLNGNAIPFLQMLDALVQRSIAIRLIHAKEPGENFRTDFDRFPRLWTQMERLLCLRVHFKCIISDGKTAYFGSANLTGAGLGAKSENRRNFENGILTDNEALITPLSEQFDSIWRGAKCTKCGRKALCADCPM